MLHALLRDVLLQESAWGRSAGRWIACLGVAASGVTGVAHAQSVIVLGDSIAWGYQPSNARTPSDGDQGWAALAADAWGRQWSGGGGAGSRPSLFNLGVPGETSHSFFLGGEEGTLLNTRYAQPNPPTQQALFTSIANERADVRKVVVSIGANDLFGLVEDLTFLFASEAERERRIAEVVNAFAPRYADVLGQARLLAPEAELITFAYYNPLNAFLLNDVPDDDFIAEIGRRPLEELNASIMSISEAYGARVVDLSAAFAGREDVLTHALDDDVHPTDAGYVVIADLVVPSPGSFGLFVAAGLGAARRRR